MSEAARLYREMARPLWLPPTKLRVSEFADQELVVTTGPLQGSHWRTDFAPYQRGILDAFHEPGVEISVVMGSSQWGKTSIAVALVGYHIAHEPCPILVVEPTVDPMAKDFAKNRLDTIIAASPILRNTVSKKRAKDSSNTTLNKTFKGGSLSIGGANSAASLASRSVRVLVLDELDRYPPELSGEGATIEIALKRTAAYRTRRRVFLISSPTLKGAPIHVWFERGDQRRYHVPCPSCGHMHPYEWKNVKWKGSDPSTARLHCPSCKYGIDEAERVAILGDGEWRASRPERDDKSIVSFHVWEAYSPFSSLEEMAKGLLKARKAQKSGDHSQMHTWQNTTLGEPIEPYAGEGVESHTLITRRESYGEEVDAPEGVSCITMGVDTQDDRLEALVFGWGRGEECWLLDRKTFWGDTSQPQPWRKLDELLDHEYRHALGMRLPIRATCIDSGGHRTTMVYDYAARQAARSVFAIVGRTWERPIVSSPTRQKWGRHQRKIPLYTVGVDAAKALMLSRFRLTEKEKGPGYFHVPLVDWADEELAAQLTSERLVTQFRKGVPRQEWRKVRERNDALDCMVYALAALRLVHPDLDLLGRRLRGEPEPKPPRPPEPKRRWIEPKPEGWLRGRRR